MLLVISARPAVSKIQRKKRSIRFFVAGDCSSEILSCDGTRGQGADCPRNRSNRPVVCHFRASSTAFSKESTVMSVENVGQPRTFAIFIDLRHLRVRETKRIFILSAVPHDSAEMHSPES